MLVYKSYRILYENGARVEPYALIGLVRIVSR